MKSHRLNTLKILMLEDIYTDAELIKRELFKGSFSFDTRRIETKESYVKELREYKPDLILSDYSLPSFDGMSALKIANMENPDTPFIFVTGAMGEEWAIETLKSGATDYVLKDRLSRLIPAVERALREVNERKERALAEKALKESEERYRILYESNPTMYFTVDEYNTVLSVNNFGSEQLGYSVKELIGRNVLEIFYSEDRAEVRDYLKRCLMMPKKIAHWEFRKVRKNGSIFWVKEVARAVKDKEGNTVILIVCEDITERKQAEEALKESEERFRSLYENATIGIYRTTPSGSILLANPAMLKMLGYDSLEELKKINIAVSGFHNVEERGEFKELIEEHGIVSGFETRWRKADGSTIYVRESSRAIRDEKGNTLYYEGAVEDITEKKKALEALIKAKEKAEQSDKLKSEFLAQMSHEIRTPINAILSFSSLLRDELQDKVEEELKTSFSIISKAGKRIIRTIDLILNMSEIQTGSYEYNPRKIDLYSDVLTSLFSEFKQAAEDKELNFKLEKSTERSIIYADDYTVKQIFENLIDNAIKYTFEGDIVISLYQDLAGRLTASVKDTGIGITEEYIPNLFHPFTQEEQGYTRKFEGNGLGLALVKKYCELNNAEINVESMKNSGSIFTVMFKNNGK